MAEYQDQQAKRALRRMRYIQAVMWAIVALALCGLLHSYNLI